MGRRIWLAVIVLVAFTCIPSAASPPIREKQPVDDDRGAGTGNVARPGLLRYELASIADQVKRLLVAQGQDSISIGAFSGPAQMPGNAGAGIVAVLTEELGRRGIRVARRASLGLKGEYKASDGRPEAQGRLPSATSVPKVAPAKILSAVLKARVEDSDGAILLEVRRETRDEATLAALFGLSFDHRFTKNGRQNQLSTLRESFDKPQPVLDGTMVKGRPDSPYAVEILAKTDDERYVARAPRDEEGLAFVPLRRGEVYAVRLTNRSDFDAAATLTIDGLSMFAFSKDKGNPRLIIPAHKSTTIVGWHRTHEVSDEFLITSYAKGAAAELNSSSEDVGTITATFAAAWTDVRPPDEPLPDLVPMAEADATGKGKQVESKFTRVQREIGMIRAAVSIRYTKTKP
jgi:hypothetical protein